MSPLDLSLSELLDHLGNPAEPLGGSSASALAAAMGLKLFEKALSAPDPETSHARAGEEREVIATLRKRVVELVAEDARVIGALNELMAQPEHPSKPQRVIVARMAAYRVSRRLVDMTIQGLSRVQAPLEFGAFRMVADVEAGWRLLSASMEGAVAACEGHLKPMDQRFAERERAALAKQAQQGREMAARALGALSWRRGHYS